MSVNSKVEEGLVGAVKTDKKDSRPGWDELAMGGVITDPGNGRAYQTGDWRSERPVIDLDSCINCFFCWVFCPDGSILTEDKKVVGIDYYHCKGCGICAQECPKKCIEMVNEETALRQEAELAEKSESRS